MKGFINSYERYSYTKGLPRLVLMYRVARNFCRGLFLRFNEFFCVLPDLKFKIRTDRFFLLGINFCHFQKVPKASIDNILRLVKYVQ